MVIVGCTMLPLFRETRFWESFETSKNIETANKALHRLEARSIYSCMCTHPFRVALLRVVNQASDSSGLINTSRSEKSR